MCPPKNGVRSGFLEAIFDGYQHENDIDEENESDEVNSVTDGEEYQ